MELSKKECVALASLLRILANEQPAVLHRHGAAALCGLTTRLLGAEVSLPEPTLTEAQQYWARREKEMDAREARIAEWQASLRKQCRLLGAQVANLYKMRTTGGDK